MFPLTDFGVLNTTCWLFAPADYTWADARRLSILVSSLQVPVILVGPVISFSALLIQDDSPALSTPSEDCYSDAMPIIFNKSYLDAFLALPGSALKQHCVIPAQIAGDGSSGLPSWYTQQCLT